MANHHHEHEHDHGHHVHDHGHAHGIGHAHAPANFGNAFRIAIGLNVAIVVLQAVLGWVAGSVALMADAGHNLSDVLGLLVAYAAVALSAKRPSSRFTYGLGKSSILAALFNALLLLLAVGALSWEALERLRDPQPVAGGIVMAAAAVGMLLNGFSAWLLASRGGRDINMRGAYLHMIADAAVSAGVVAAGLVVVLTGWLWVDPVVSLVVNAVIVWGTWSLLRQSVAMSLAGVPDGVDYEAVRAFLAGRSGVVALHDLHIWPLSTTDTALTAHLVMPAGPPGDGFLMATAAELKATFGIGHVTLQVEIGGDTVCELALAHPA